MQTANKIESKTMRGKASEAQTDMEQQMNTLFNSLLTKL